MMALGIFFKWLQLLCILILGLYGFYTKILESIYKTIADKKDQKDKQIRAIQQFKNQYDNIEVKRAQQSIFIQAMHDKMIQWQRAQKELFVIKQNQQYAIQKTNSERLKRQQEFLYTLYTTKNNAPIILKRLKQQLYQDHSSLNVQQYTDQIIQFLKKETHE